MINRRTFMLSSAAVLSAPYIARAQADSYVLGALLAMSGAQAFDGQNRAEGVQLAVEHITQDGWLKKPITLQVEDSLGTPQGGAIGVTKLINVNRANMVLTAFTGVSKAAAPIAERSQTVVANVGGVSPDLAGITPHFWNTVPLASKELEQLLPWMLSKGLKKVSIVYVDDPFGNELVTWLDKNLAAGGGSLSGTFSIPGNAQQFGAVAAKVRDVGPDAVFIASYGSQQAQIIKQLRDNGVNQQLLSYSGTVNDFVAALPEAEGMVFGMPALEADDAVSKRFVADFAKKHNKTPNYLHANSYNGALIFGQIVKSLEASGTELTGDALNAEAKKINSFDLVGGKGVFDDTFCISLPIQIMTFKAGKLAKLDS